MKITPNETDKEICLLFEHEGGGMINHEAATAKVLGYASQTPGKQVVLDLAKVPYATSPFLAILIMVAKELAQRPIILRNATKIENSLKTFGVAHLFDIEG